MRKTPYIREIDKDKDVDIFTKKVKTIWKIIKEISLETVYYDTSHINIFLCVSVGSVQEVRSG